MAESVKTFQKNAKAYMNVQRVQKWGVLTFLNSLNYGALLQTYALQYALREKGVDVEVIDYRTSVKNVPFKGICFGDSLHRLKRWVGLFVMFVGKGCVYCYIDALRRKRTNLFLKNYIAVSIEKYVGSEELARISEYQGIIVGSDQVWNYRYAQTPNEYLLEKIEDAIVRVSYAASFGFKHLPDIYIKSYCQGLSKFKAISVREKEGQTIVSSLIERKAKWVVDPTLLLSRTQWAEIVTPDNDKRQEYLLCYWVGDFKNNWCNIKSYLKRYKKIKIYGFQSQVYGSFVWEQWFFRLCLFLTPGVELCYANGPIAFLRDISNASAVLTDSFHAVMFSCIYQRPLRVITGSSSVRANMESRIVDFTNRVGMADCRSAILQPLTVEDVCNPDYDHVGEKIDVWREESWAYLSDALDCKELQSISRCVQ